MMVDVAFHFLIIHLVLDTLLNMQVQLIYVHWRKDSLGYINMVLTDFIQWKYSNWPLLLPAGFKKFQAHYIHNAVNIDE